MQETMNKKNAIYIIIGIFVVVLYCFGQFLFYFLGTFNIGWFAISIIPFVLVYVIMRFWDKDLARKFGIIHLIMLGVIILIMIFLKPEWFYL